MVKVLLLDLYIAWCGDPSLKIMFSRDNNTYKSRFRYSELHIGKTIIGIVDTLVSEGIICEQKGFNDRVSGIGFQSRLWASEWLQERFKQAKFSQFAIEPHEDRETVILRNGDKDPEEYQDTTETLRMRQVLSGYNQLLSNTHIDIYDLETPVLEIGSGTKIMRLQINQQDKFVRRVFINGRWNQGGSFYGGWWQRCPKGYRKKIMMDGIMTAEIDFSGLNIVILYAQEGINFWAEINQDPYQLNGMNDIYPDINIKDAAKLLMLTAINAEDDLSAYQAFRFQAEKGSAKKRMTNEQLSSMLNDLKKKHDPIANILASGAGIDLMYVDSQITEDLISTFTHNYKCPILTVHDSYIVPFGYDHFLKKEMQAAFEKVTGISGSVVNHATEYFDKIEQEPPSDVPPTHHNHYANPPSQRHLKELDLFREFKDKPDPEPWVADWTYVY
ncbi:hypothetical protein N9E48_08910 [Paracoccaceae bacterium]|nr:hypothetical protein [Paracoccaceae bacterium]